MNNAFHIPKVVVGIFLVVAVGSVILGGIKRVAAITEKLVPFMVILYFIGAIVIICLHASLIPDIFHAIFLGAFSIHAVAGGGFGAGIALAMKMGFKRGVFSNEAGLGSSVMVHSSSNVKEPVRQGMWGIFEVFADTIVVCTLTAIVILGSGAIDLTTGLADEEVLEAIGGSSNLMSYSFEQTFGALGSGFIAIAILLFAYSTVLGWSHYGATACRYLFGEKAVFPYRLVFVGIVFLGSIMEAELAWNLSDTFNGLMMIPNLIGVLVLSPQVVHCTKNYALRHFKMTKVKPMLSMFDDVEEVQLTLEDE